MFVHTVLFEIKPSQVAPYRKDSLMWARFAKRHKGFVSYATMVRINDKNQYASVYTWKNKAGHERFMNKYHDWLVGKSKAKVKPLGYFNLSTLDRVK